VDRVTGRRIRGELASQSAARHLHMPSGTRPRVGATTARRQPPAQLVAASWSGTAGGRRIRLAWWLRQSPHAVCMRAPTPRPLTNQRPGLPFPFFRVGFIRPVLVRHPSLSLSFSLSLSRFCQGMYNLNTTARYFKYKTQLKHNIIQWSCLKHMSYHIHCTNQNIQ
jgi:hypothetical protein